MAMLVALASASRAQLPNDARGFGGQVQGIVMSKGARSSFELRVTRIIHLRKDSKADRAEALLGQTVAVWPRWQKKDGIPIQSPLHAAFIHTLKLGQEVTLEICNFEMSHFEIIGLSEEQRKTAESVSKEELDKADRKPKPEGRVTKARVDGLQSEIEQLREKVRKLREELDRRKE